MQNIKEEEGDIENYAMNNFNIVNFKPTNLLGSLFGKCYSLNKVFKLFEHFVYVIDEKDLIIKTLSNDINTHLKTILLTNESKVSVTEKNKLLTKHIEELEKLQTINNNKYSVELKKVVDTYKVLNSKNEELTIELKAVTKDLAECNEINRNKIIINNKETSNFSNKILSENLKLKEKLLKLEEKIKTMKPTNKH